MWGNVDRKTFVVDAMDGNTRLDRWCQRILGSAPNSVYQKALRTGRIRLNGKKAEGSVRVFEGDIVEVRGDITNPDKAQAPREKQPMKLTLELAQEAQSWVLYKDKDILVINKPAGLAVQGGSKVVKHLSPFIKFKNASKETVDASDELVEELRLAMIQAGQKLAKHIRREAKANELEEKIRHMPAPSARAASRRRTRRTSTSRSPSWGRPWASTWHRSSASPPRRPTA